MKKHFRQNWLHFICIATALFTTGSEAAAQPTEIYCTIQDSPSRLNCQWIEKDLRRKMSSGDISNFIDQAQIGAYITVKSRTGQERVFMIDPDAPSFKKLNDIKSSGSISDISKAKSDLFTEIENRAIKISADLDGQAKSAELVKFDPSVAVDKSRLEKRDLLKELENYRSHDLNFVAGQKAIEGESEVVSSLTKSRHKLSLIYQNVGYAGKFNRSSSMSDYSSRDNAAGSLIYKYTPGNWSYETEFQTYNVYSNFTKGSSGGSVNFTGTDSSVSVYNLYLRGNRCFSMGSNGLFCPGLEVGYDGAPVLGFRTLRFTGVNLNNTTLLEMQKVTDLLAGPTILLQFPLFRTIKMVNRLGFLYGTGVTGTVDNNKPTANSAYYINSLFEWPMWKGVSMGFAVEYKARAISFDTNGTGASTRTVAVENTGVSQISTGVQFSWLFGE